MANPTPAPPTSILVLGAGIFGLSTCLSLLSRPPFSEASQITLLEASPDLPNPHGSSVDSSRIIRPDYASAAYVRLMREAQHLWRETDWGADGRYTESGVMYVATRGQGGGGEEYLKKALANVKALAEKDEFIGGRKGKDGIQELNSYDEIRKAGKVVAAGNWGYLNEGSGWADAAKCVEFGVQKLEKEGVEKGKLKILTGKIVKRLVFSDDGSTVKGALLEDGETITADLVILATGAWTPTLVDLRGRAVATGQALAYVELDSLERSLLENQNLPVILNEEDGTFIIPPRDGILKIARHGYGYRNPVQIPNPMPGKEGEQIEVSIPVVDHPVPKEGQDVCRASLKNMLKCTTGVVERKFSNTRVCWYCDTPTGDFIITPHPAISNLILATGGSGHGFKFFPIIGEKIVDLISDHLGLTKDKMDPELKHIWRWRSDEEVGLNKTCMELECEDGSRGGTRGMIWSQEIQK